MNGLESLRRKPDLLWQRKMRRKNSQESFQMRTKPNSTLKQALMKSTEQAQKCFLMKGRALRLACLAQTKSIGAKKLKTALG